ncbi:helix-turn-helix transcriptional regulator [Irregularibacter muris]|uniref:Helix-turn-helix transcriptional regulator n=1 Tax=Irregularibacter muris TaxID=1796619 RepID=A0AAE3L2U8_9FIRM|nr:helix-turn-helix transcriptional regulator [Irregularibacter muris]MCR1899324.1 helix-turn-helix transcriptional regulator [Irregularibacter muris]
MRKRKLTPFGLRVKNRLADLNMSQKVLAEKLGTSDVYLSMILYGERSGDMYIENIKLFLNIEDDCFKA